MTNSSTNRSNSLVFPKIYRVLIPKKYKLLLSQPMIEKQKNTISMQNPLFISNNFVKNWKKENQIEASITYKFFIQHASVNVAQMFKTPAN